jgi:hypothetical protein
VAWRRPRPGTGRGPLGEQVGHGERRALRVDAVVIGQHGHREPLAREAEHGEVERRPVATVAHREPPPVLAQH